MKQRGILNPHRGENPLRRELPPAVLRSGEDLQYALLNQGEPLVDVVLRLVACLLNAHEELLPATYARIENPYTSA